MENIIKRQELPTEGVLKVEIVDSSTWTRTDIIGLVGLTGIVVTVVLTVVLIRYAKKLDLYMRKQNDITEASNDIQRKTNEFLGKLTSQQEEGDDNL